ncbi:hypothetical protein [Streptosporangium pseudovulgare]|uniref:Uncharacterized protein n=1 Tax=Streptosporangium pseudovulgare TaxID=35765 RepID=A0ABQ2R8A4_9ACTN|nr:hypothetical protein [Streptosporangium pseudovulgare]GGQ15248.1 hypothetical protein GCM10010140_51810 [Streptosporangium pseudovulgare]
MGTSDDAAGRPALRESALPASDRRSSPGSDLPPPDPYFFVPEAGRPAPVLPPASPEPDFRMLDRRERAVIGRMLAGLTLGMALSLAGRTAAGALPAHVVAFYDPYLYGVLILAMTRGISRPGWALLTGCLTGAGIAAGHMTAHALDHQTPLVPGGTGDTGGIGWEMAALAVVLIAFGLTGHLCRRPGRCGDLVVGALSGVLLARFAQELRSAELLDRVGSLAVPWSLAALAVMGLALPVILRPTAAARVRTAAVTLICAALCVVVLSVLPLFG